MSSDTRLESSEIAEVIERLPDRPGGSGREIYNRLHALPYGLEVFIYGSGDVYESEKCWVFALRSGFLNHVFRYDGSAWEYVDTYRTSSSRESIFDNTALVDSLRPPDEPGTDIGANPYFGPDWPAQREAAIERDNGTCQHDGCDMTRERHIETYGHDIHVHHITPRKDFRTDDTYDYEAANHLENLITYCNPCHQRNETR